MAALLAVPLLLFGPLLAAGQVFLPYLPVALEPLAGENPEAAAEARREANWTLGDRIFPFLTEQLSARKELGAGHLPTWQPLQGLGQPLFGGSIAGLAYPPNALALLLAPERAAALQAIVTLFLAGLGMALLLRRLELDPRAALFGALAYQLGGWGLANLFYAMKVDAALWLPWALWAVEGLARSRRWSAPALVGSLAASFLAGMVSISVFVLGATLLYGALRLGPDALRGPRRAAGARRCAGFLLCLALGVAGAGLQVLPLAQAGRGTLRKDMSPALATANSQPCAAALGVLLPDLVAEPSTALDPSRLPIAWWLTPAEQADRAQNTNALEWNDYALVACVLLALAGLIAAPRRAAFPAFLLLGCFAFAQAWTPVRWLYALPGLALGSPVRILGLSWALWPWLAAVGLDALLRRAPRALPTLGIAALACSLGAFVAWRSLEPASWAQGLERRLLADFPDQTLESVRAAIPREVSLAAGHHLRDSLAGLLGASLAVLVCAALARFLERRRPRFEREPGPGLLLAGGASCVAAALLPLALVEASPGRFPQALLALSGVVVLVALALRRGREDLALWLPLTAVLMLEGFLAAGPHVVGRSILTQGLFPPSPSIDAVRLAAGDGRVLRLDTDPGQGFAQVQALARPNLLVGYGIRDLSSYPTFTPRTLAELWQHFDPPGLARNHVARLSTPELLGRPLLDLLGVRCLLSVAPLQHPALEPVLERDGFCVYRRPSALPAARIVPRAEVGRDDQAVLEALCAPDCDLAARTLLAPDEADGLDSPAPPADWRPGTIVLGERVTGNQLRLSVQGSQGGWLVLHEQWAPGWKAWIDGQPVRVRRADHACQALPLPSGDLELEFRYEPPVLEWGAALTLVALLGVLARELLAARAEQRSES